MWAERNLPKADPPMLAAFEALLDEENPDLLKWLTGQLEPPEALRKNPAFVVRGHPPFSPMFLPWFLLYICMFCDCLTMSTGEQAVDCHLRTAVICSGA